ncbi:hypothetical protein [Endozoicomonas sp. 8E]
MQYPVTAPINACGVTVKTTTPVPNNATKVFIKLSGVYKPHKMGFLL